MSSDRPALEPPASQPSGVWLGYPILRTLADRSFDFFIALGDMIYADSLCTETGLLGNSQVPDDFGVATDMASFWAHWKYNREDAGLRALMASRASYAVWDDHEVVNDFGPMRDKDARLAPARAACEGRVCLVPACGPLRLGLRPSPWTAGGPGTTA